MCSNGYISPCMAIIKPFIAQHFSRNIGDLSELVAPPYDVLSPEEREHYANKNPYNTVWLTLPESLPDDRSKFVKYARSASRLAEWRREGVLNIDSNPGFYRYAQTFKHPITQKEHTRTSLICLLKLEPYENGVVLPHEQTFPKHKEDRLRLLEATRSHLECIYGLYADERGAVENAIENAKFEHVRSVRTPDGVIHDLYRCTDENANSEITQAMQIEKIWIADGHHRYETALNYRNQMKNVSGEIPEDYMMIALSSMRGPGLIILPTHRIITKCEIHQIEIANRLRTFFHVKQMGNNELIEGVRHINNPKNRIFGIVLPLKVGYLALMTDADEALNLIKGDMSDLLKELDVTILHEVILKRVFEIESPELLEFTRSAEEAVNKVESGERPAAILTNPPSVSDMRKIAEIGEKMPQKSTYYYPKLLSGLVFWSLSDFK